MRDPSNLLKVQAVLDFKERKTKVEPEKIMTNDIKKGERVKQRNGWEAKILDNMRGNIRIAEVYGDFTESGSIYMHDVTHVQRDGKWLPVTHTPKQLEMREMLDGLGW